MKRIVLTGSESTGKSTLAAELADHFHAPLVPEFLRIYASRLETDLGPEDVDAIARGQIELEDRIASASAGRNLMILDTDLLSAVVYNHHYYGDCPAWIEEEFRTRAGDLYLLMDIDAPWIPDRLRDRGDRREEMHGLFRTALSQRGLNWVVIRGSWEERRRGAVEAVERVLKP